jgi:hypothetical protein
LNNFARRESRRSQDEGVNVVFNPAHLQCCHLIFARDAADIFSHTLLNFGLDEAGAVLGAENDVVVQRRVCVGHNRTLNRRYATRKSFAVACRP